MKNKKYLYVFFVFVFLLGIGNSVYEHFRYPKPMIFEKINLKEDVSISKKITFSKNGCYEVGLWSDSDIFDGRGVMKMSQDGRRVYPISGEYMVSYYDGDMLLYKEVVDTGNLSSVSMDGPSRPSKIGFDRLEIPFKGKYKSFTVAFDIKNPKDQFKNSEKDIYFFIDKTLLSCSERVKKIVKRRKYNIDIPENNVTLQPLYRALIQKDVQMVEKLIDVNRSFDSKMIGERKPIHYAAFTNDIDTLQYLINKGADIDVKDILGKTPLHYGIENNAIKTVKVLLENGADLSLVREVDDYMKLKKGYSYDFLPVIHYVVFNDLQEILQLLLSHNLNPNYTRSKSHWTVLDTLDGWKNANNNAIHDSKEIPHPNLDAMTKLLVEHGAIRRLSNSPQGLEQYINYSEEERKKREEKYFQNFEYDSVLKKVESGDE